MPLGLLLCFGCQSAPAECNGNSCAAATASANTTIAYTPTVSPTPTATQTPTATATPTPTRIPTSTTPMPFPATYQSKRLLQGVKPQTYLADQCEFLQNRWGAGKSAPGTIVVPVMFHGIDRGGDNNTPLDDFKATIYYAQQAGYQTITMKQFVAFLESNTSIPPRSMVWIIDDRIAGTVEKYFISPDYTPPSWTFSSAWPIATTDDDLWRRVKAMHDTGRVEIQAHGYLHNDPLVDAWVNFPPNGMTSEAFLRHEIVEPIEILKEKVGEAPTALVWPGGGFSARAIAMARQAGYKAAFTANARGPIMFDWVPLNAEEAATHAPLFVIPRHWGAPGLVRQLQQSAFMGNEAAAFARKNYPAEAAYFRSMCGGELPALPEEPTPLPDVVTD
jgi:hypothetical protein